MFAAGGRQIGAAVSHAAVRRSAVISCLMVTQAARLPLAARAIADFAAQTHAPRELVVLHDGDTAAQTALQDAAACSPAPVRVLACAPAPLGTLRQRAVAAARGEWVCQWDDDDRYHPQRLALQWQSLQQAGAAFGFLVDQLHWFPASGELFWDDWEREPYPLNLIPGSLLGRRDLLPAYPPLARGEDTAVVHEVLRRGYALARLRDAGWCYVYTCHGDNTWSQAHHRAIVAAKAMGPARLLRAAATLRARLAEYAPPLGALRLPYRGGELRLDT